MRLVNAYLSGAPAPLRAPSPAGYLLLATDIDRRPPFLPNSRRKRTLIQTIAPAIARLDRLPGVVSADVFDARLIAPGATPRHARRSARQAPSAHFDLVVLVQTSEPATAVELRDQPDYRHVAAALSVVARRQLEVAARNVRRIADVDRDRPAVHLFNYFAADDPDLLLPVWERTAGWFVANTDLRNSTVLMPMSGEPDEFGMINHASWPRYATFLPSLILRPSFRRFVLATFAANGISVQPILYRLVPPATHAAAATSRPRVAATRRTRRGPRRVPARSVLR
jgi:hypothetical protein